jgi:chemotaxis protein methyltransferase CheR
LQDRALTLFHDSLARNGFLGLGAKENIRFSCQAANFTDFSREERVYQKRRVA